MSEKFTSLLAACAVTLAVFAATSPAAAKQGPIVVTATQDIPVRLVSYRDLNLAKAEHEKMLVSRVRYAARDVCTESVRFDTAFGNGFTSCRTQALDGARPQIDRAVERARQIAANGWSAIAPVAISISVR